MRESRRRGRTGLPRGVRASAPRPPARRLDTHLDDASPPPVQGPSLRVGGAGRSQGPTWASGHGDTRGGGGGGGGAFSLVTIPLAHGTREGQQGRESSPRRGAPCASGAAPVGWGQCLQGVGRCTRLNVFVVLASDYLTIIKIEITKCERVPLQRRVLLSREVPRLPVRAPVSQTVPSGE